MVVKNGLSAVVETGESFTPANMNLNVQETGEQTIQRILSTYDIGQKLRQLRLRKKIALVDLGKHTGLSASMLSQLETGKMIPTLPTLARIAMVFDVGLDFFFDDRRRRKLFTVSRSRGFFHSRILLRMPCILRAGEGTTGLPGGISDSVPRGEPGTHA